MSSNGLSWEDRANDEQQRQRQMQEELNQRMRQAMPEQKQYDYTIDQRTFMPKDMPTGRDAPGVQFEVQRAVEAYNRGLRESAAGTLRGALGTLQTYSRGGAAALTSGVFGQLANTYMQSQIGAPDVSYWARVDEMKRRTKAARKAAYLQAGATLLSSAITALPGLINGGAGMGLNVGLQGGTVDPGQESLPASETGGYAGQQAISTEPGAGALPAGEAAGGAGGQPQGGPQPQQMQARQGQGPGPQAPQGQPQGKPGGPQGQPQEGAPGGGGQGPQAMGGGGGGGGGVDAFGMGVVKGGNIVQDVAMGTGAPTPLFIAATLEADPEIMERHDAFLDGLEMRLMQMAGV